VSLGSLLGQDDDTLSVGDHLVVVVKWWQTCAHSVKVVEITDALTHGHLVGLVELVLDIFCLGGKNFIREIETHKCIQGHDQKVNCFIAVGCGGFVEDPEGFATQELANERVLVRTGSDIVAKETFLHVFPVLKHTEDVVWVIQHFDALLNGR
jgi:hypothetical protein